MKDVTDCKTPGRSCKSRYNGFNATENMMPTSVTISHLEGSMVLITESTSMYIEVGEIWGFFELERFCDAEMIDIL